MYRNFKFILAILISVVSFGPVQSRVIVQETEKTYQVVSKNGGLVFSKFLKTGTPFPNAVNGLAATDTYVTFKAGNGRTLSKDCSGDDLDIVISLVYTYPKWRGYNAANAKSKRSWKKFVRVLKKSQKKNYRISVNAARKADKKRRRKSGERSVRCRDLIQAIRMNMARSNGKQRRQRNRSRKLVTFNSGIPNAHPPYGKGLLVRRR